MEHIKIATRQVTLSLYSRQNADPLAICKPAAVTKEEIRGWRHLRPLSTDQHTDLNMEMWNRASFPTPCNQEHRTALPKTRPSDFVGNVSSPTSQTETFECIPRSNLLATATVPDSVREPDIFAPVGQKHIISPRDNTAESPDALQASNGDTSASPGERGDDLSGCTENVTEALAEQLESTTGQDFWGPVVAYLRAAK